MKPLHIAAHNGAHLFGGAERYLVRLLVRLRERGHRVVLYCADDAVAGPAEAAGLEVELLRLGGHASVHDAATFAGRLTARAPDALLLGTFKKTWLGGMAGRMARVPRVIARIGLETDLPSRGVVYRVAFRRWLDGVVVNAAALREPVLASLPGLPPERVVVIPNAVDAPPRSRPPGELRRSLGIPDGAAVVGAVARLAAQKQLDLLLRAVARTNRVHCVLAGDGPERARLERLAREVGVANRVHLLGHREDVGDVLAALDLFVVTSRVEGMSSAMLEALAAGVPVVSTPVSGAAEALAPLAGGRRPGAIVGHGEGEISREIIGLLADPGALAQMGAAARAAAVERFAWPEQLARWERVLSGSSTST